MLNFCIGASLALVILIAILLWAALVAAKEGDRKIVDQDIKIDLSRQETFRSIEFN
jgi:hypothetical protein